MKLHRTSNQQPVTLGEELGCGGEGAVYELADDPALVAKIYTRTPDATKVDKLRSMVRHADPELLRIAAWPLDLLADASGTVQGFLMPRVSAREDAHELYSPRSRRRAFPQADFTFVARASTNLARAFARMHQAGHVIGDVNHGNALVGRDATVMLIDCDSFQVRDGEQVFPCDVGVPLFTAPELQGKPFRGMRRDEGHDTFGLAVLLFHLLYLGRHPYAGRFDGGDMPIERAIAESHFVYGANRNWLSVLAPPGTLRLDAFGPAIAQLFERAFAPPGQSPRPTAAEWTDALQALEADLRQCEVSARHQHPGPACCWCELEKRAGVRTYDSGKPESEDYTGMADRLWEAIAKIPMPERYFPDPDVVRQRRAIDGQQVQQTEDSQLAKGCRDFLRGLLTFIVAVVVFVLMMSSIEALITTIVVVTLGLGTLFIYLAYLGGRAWWQRKAAKPISKAPLIRAPLERWMDALDQWNDCNSAAPFTKAWNELLDAKRKLSSLSDTRSGRLAAVAAPHEARQLETYLSAFPLESARFTDVKRADIAALASNGIRHAGDVLRERDRLHQLVYLVSVRELLRWTDACSDAFIFNGNDPGLVADIRSIEGETERERERYIRALKEGPERLRKTAEDIAERRVLAEKALADVHRELLEGEAQ